MKTLYISIFLLFSFLSFSCQDWLDVQPSTEIEADEFFKDESGFKSALTGVYTLMLGNEYSSLYSKDLMFDFMEELAMRYDAGNRATDAGTRAKYFDYVNEYSGFCSKTYLSNIWNGMYRNIVNINNLLAHLDETGRDVIHTPRMFEIIKGEALGLRAYHYLDLLRMWGPADMITNGSRPVVPYRTKVGYEQIAPMSADSLTLMIEKDLLEAELLLENDDFDITANNTEIPFFSDRQHRMNKWALKALMARFYLYTNQPDKAATKAKSVIDSCGLELIGALTKDQAMFGETLFALDYYNMESSYNGIFEEVIDKNSSSQKLLNEETLRSLYEVSSVGANDIRFTQGFNTASGVCMSKKFLVDDNANYKSKLPLIRLSEMYYILAETLSGTEATDYFNKIRNTRGISKRNDIHGFASREQMVEELRKEYAKDFFGEGQYFFFLKRHQVRSFEAWMLWPVNPMLDQYYEFVIPDGEKEWGNVPDVEE